MFNVVVVVVVVVVAVEVVVTGQHGGVVVAAGQANRGDWAPLSPPRPLLHGTQSEGDSTLEALEPRLIGSITKEAGGTNLNLFDTPITAGLLLIRGPTL